MMLTTGEQRHGLQLDTIHPEPHVSLPSWLSLPYILVATGCLRAALTIFKGCV
jgi:hypothetical protein